MSNQMGPIGVMEWLDGKRYEGSFTDAKKHGEGTLIWPDGRSYEGQWEAGQQHGYGVVVSVRGQRRKSQWNQGSFVRWLEDPISNGKREDH
mmetsp:Transcript_4763/g.6083  ORF Transcript_4763/g.6083 Transcript_4763/m.6083 type:complete len:91 (-) Transcript_4763:75-347(-)